LPSDSSTKESLSIEESENLENAEESREENAHQEDSGRMLILSKSRARKRNSIVEKVQQNCSTKKIGNQTLSLLRQHVTQNMIIPRLQQKL
jgi:hypothetical protein